MAAKMKCQIFSRVFLCFLFFFSNVASWTIDLPAIRKQLFEENDAIKKYSKENHNDIRDGRVLYSNIHGNSKHNEEEESHTEYSQYAQAFRHQSYMEKEVSDIVHDGGVYLEGLRKALESYSVYLEGCKTLNPQDSNSTWTPRVSPNATSNTTGPDNTAEISSLKLRMTCKEATEASEKVRRYAHLAMWATKRLQDLGYAGNYQKKDEYEENELILKLAWFLDQLAHLTGYEPSYSQYITRRYTTTSTTSPTAPTLIPQTQELTNYLANCLKTHSSVPAVDRCRYPLAMPDSVAQIVGATTPSQPDTDGVSSRVNRNYERKPNDPLELLIAADDHRTRRKISKRSPTNEEYIVPIPVHHEKPKPVVDFIVKKLTNLKEIVKSVKKNAVADFASQLAHHKHHHHHHHLHKREIDTDSAVVNKIEFPLKQIVKNLQSNDHDNENTKLDSVEKFDQPIVKSDTKSDESIEIFDQPIVKSDTKSDESIEKSDDSIVRSDESVDIVDKSNVDVISLKQFPVLDASVVNTKSFKKRSIRYKSSSNLLNVLPIKNKEFKVAVKNKKRRAIDDPLSKLTSYYIKHKVWDGANPTSESNKNSETSLEVINDLHPKIKTKRSLTHKKYQHLILPHSAQFSTTKINKKIKKNDKTKLEFYLNNMLGKKYKKIQKNTHKIKKRSTHYENMYLPRIPENPVGDISYYLKIKRGRNYNPSLTQAALVRTGLQQAFETGNILVIQRYGSNYNPAVPSPFYRGVLAGAADN